LVSFGGSPFGIASEKARIKRVRGLIEFWNCGFVVLVSGQVITSQALLLPALRRGEVGFVVGKIRTSAYTLLENN
jgi:hypothetical protein